MTRRVGPTLAAASLLASKLAAQAPTFQTPGMPTYASPPPAGQDTGQAGQAGQDSGQAGRFTSAFNPAFSFIVDALGSALERENGDDGFEAELRTLEFAANAHVDPNAWAYFVTSTDGEDVNLEEAAIHYTGFGGHDTLRAGRFFIDFGKQMQTHVHELRTVDRPLVLRTYLGDEVQGDGLQWDSWTSVGDSTAIRWSIGAFADLLPELDDDFDPATEAEPDVATTKDLGDFNYTARLTGFRDVGERGVLQLGASARAIPSYDLTFAPSGDVAEDLHDYVFGLDATYGWTGDTGEERWTLGGELLVDVGDTGSEIVGNSIDVLDDTLAGFYVFADYAWDRYRSVGVQFSSAELPGSGDPDAHEIVAYYTRNLSEFHRLRLSLSSEDSDLDGRESRIALEYTAFLGAHGHGVNW